MADAGDSTPEGVTLDTSVAHPARVYDYWLGGKDNFAADREAAEQVIAANPTVLHGVRANRAFLGRAVRYLAAEAGIDRKSTRLNSSHPSISYAVFCLKKKKKKKKHKTKENTKPKETRTRK